LSRKPREKPLNGLGFSEFLSQQGSNHHQRAGDEDHDDPQGR